MTSQYADMEAPRLVELLEEHGRRLESGKTHGLEKPFIESIIGTMQYYGSNATQDSQAWFDLSEAKYRIFDWLMMQLNGRCEITGDEGATEAMRRLMKKFAVLYLEQKHVGGFAWWLRGHDMDVEEPGRCEDCIRSYDEYMEERTA